MSSLKVISLSVTIVKSSFKLAFHQGYLKIPFIVFNNDRGLIINDNVGLMQLLDVILWVNNNNNNNNNNITRQLHSVSNVEVPEGSCLPRGITKKNNNNVGAYLWLSSNFCSTFSTNKTTKED